MRAAVLVIFALLAIFPCLLSQENKAPSAACLSLFNQADRLYKKGLALNSTAGYSEAEEEAINKQSKKAFAAFLTCAPLGFFWDSLRLEGFIKLGELEQYFNEPAKALEQYKNAIALKKNLSVADSLYFEPTLFAGIISYQQGAFENANQYLAAAEQIQDKYGKPLKESQRLYNNLGALRYEAGDYNAAQTYFQKALAVLQPVNPYYESLRVNYENNLAAIYIKLGNYAQAKLLYRRLLSSGEHRNEIYNNLGIISLHEALPEQAISFFKKVKYNALADAGLANDMATAYLQQRKYDLARAYLDSAAACYRRYSHAVPGTLLGMTFKTKGDLEKDNAQPVTALSFYQKALSQFYPSFRDSDIYTNPKSFAGAYSYEPLFETLVSKAEIFQDLFQKHKSLPYAKASLAAYTSAFALLTYTSQTYNSDDSRLFLEKSRYRIHSHPIDIAIELFRQTGSPIYFETAYRFDQQSKASVLALNEQANNRVSLADTQWQRERRIRAEIGRLSLQQSRLAFSGTSSMPTEAIREKEVELMRLQKDLAQRYPVATVSIPSVSDVQRLLDKNTALLSYHLTNEKLTVFTITKTRMAVKQQSYPPAFQQQLSRFINSLYKGESADTDFKNAGSMLYEILIGNMIRESYKRLIIIPDDELAYLSFETLQHKGNYLVQQCAIQYQYSTALLKKETTNFANASTLSVAPFMQEGYGGEWVALSFSGEEISSNRGKILLNKKATKQSFIANISQYDIIHLATHAVSADSATGQGYIVFAPWSNRSKEDYIMYAQEIYTLPFQNTKLVLLSACETGIGRLVRGEGLLSLSRAFAYAGCPDVVTSLWKADDEATSFILKHFHGYMNSGLSIDEALQKSKLDYLNSPQIHPRKKVPAYWAHLIFIGNYNPAQASPIWLWVVIASLSVVSVLFFKKRV